MLGIGMDFCDVNRLRGEIEAKGATFLEGVFSSAEIAYCRSRPDPVPHFAARFAAKESCLKAVPGTSLEKLSLLDVVVLRADDGQPQLDLTGRLGAFVEAMGTVRLHVSLTHTKEVAAAVVIIEEDA